MITCCLRYKIDPFKLAEFETYAAMWLPLSASLRAQPAQQMPPTATDWQMS